MRVKMVKNLSLEGLEFSTTEIHISNHIMTITLNRPEKKNAINNVMMNELNYALAFAKQEKQIRVGLLLLRVMFSAQALISIENIQIQMFQN